MAAAADLLLPKENHTFLPHWLLHINTSVSIAWVSWMKWKSASLFWQYKNKHFLFKWFLIPLALIDKTETDIQPYTEPPKTTQNKNPKNSTRLLGYELLLCLWQKSKSSS